MCRKMHLNVSPLFSSRNFKIRFASFINSTQFPHFYKLIPLRILMWDVSTALMRCTALQMKRFVFKHFHKPACVVLEKIKLKNSVATTSFLRCFYMFVSVFLNQSSIGNVDLTLDWSDRLHLEAVLGHTIEDLLYQSWVYHDFFHVNACNVHSWRRFWTNVDLELCSSWPSCFGFGRYSPCSL